MFETFKTSSEFFHIILGGNIFFISTDNISYKYRISDQPPPIPY